MRRLLPLLPTRHGSRSRMTCLYRCANQCDHPVPNQTSNPYFGDIVRSALSRRALLKGGTGGAIALGLSGLSGTAMAAPGHGETPHHEGRGPHHGRGVDRLDWTPVAPNTEDAVVVPDGFEQAIVVSWGDPVLPGAPEFDFDHQTAEAQEQQYGYNCDFLAILPLKGDRALLVSNHEYCSEQLMFRDWVDHESATEEQLRVSMAAHGLSVVEIERVGRSGQWRLVRKGRRTYNRRITATTPFEVRGPAAGSELLRTEADPEGRTVLGTFNNCAGGTTPWGTTLHGEENIHGYFGASGPIDEAHLESFARYGLPTEPAVGRNWMKVDERFDLSKHPNEAYRHGWIVELDPYDPNSRPRKHTMLGRFKHEGATTRITSDRRIVVYMGDDERFEYIYKFVSRDRYRPGDRKRNSDLLDHGTLYVARFTGDGSNDGEYDGTGEWIPLTSDKESYVEGMSVAEVLVHTRLAADKAGATKMDRPEDVEVNPKTGKVYASCTNNSERTEDQVDEANPRPSNRHGHVVELEEDGNDGAATSFRWRLLLVCGDPEDPETYFGGFDKSKVSPISCPDNIAFDGSGNLWLATDGNALGSNDGLFALPVSGPERGYVKQFLTVPIGAETCGPVISSDQRTVFVAVQHPGEVDGASPDDPASVWPFGDQPRPSVACAWRA